MGADVTSYSNEAVCLASLNGHLELVKYLVKMGADITDRNHSAVRWASSNGQLDVVKYLVKIGTDIISENNEAIFHASRYGHLETVEFLLSKGADFNKLTSKHKKYFKMKKAYSRWRRVYLRKWIRKVLIPLRNARRSVPASYARLYYSPQHRGGIQAKKELEAIIA